ncbi:hypothetical protein TELCIR_06876 [Teladorsagia circumcincta]|uniref:Uncharacterized protein n=1 Tax=Teladorsagia circumcincta TaxID=45464 RepID=A0A2G9UP39_TELCI|nr:hypothetical protein TELCIR_06876 [Teladorsagia circumcincta]
MGSGSSDERNQRAQLHTAGTKKFTFNVNAPAFKPRSASAQLQQAQQVGPPPGGPPQAMMGAVPMVPTGVPIQVPYAYQSFSVQGGGAGGGGAGVVPPPPPQGGFSGPQAPPPQMMPGTPQAAAPPPGIYPQRFVPAQEHLAQPPPQLVRIASHRRLDHLRHRVQTAKSTKPSFHGYEILPNKALSSCGQCNPVVVDPHRFAVRF